MDNRDFLIISIFTFITSLVWIFFDAYHTYKTSTIPEDLRIQMEPLPVNFPVNTINKLKARPQFFSINNQVNPLAPASPNATPSADSITPPLTTPSTNP